MKIYGWILALCVSCFFAVGAELSDDEIKDLKKRVKISSVIEEKVENQVGEEVQLIKVYTYQDRWNENVQLNYRMRMTVELEDKQKDTYFAQIMKGQGSVNREYIGKDEWRFLVPHGDLKRPKVSAYVIQYGIQQGAEFIVLAEDLDDVDELEELMERTTTRVDVESSEHYYWYIDSNDEKVRSQSN